MNDFHYIQIEILKALLFAESLRFSDLKNKINVENNSLNFHLNTLINQKLIFKDSDKSVYELTNLGKEKANRIESESSRIKPQGKISAITCCVKNLNSNDPELLIYTRLKHPFFGSQGYASGKVPYGQGIIESAERELKEETSLNGNAELFMIEHHRVYNKNTEELLEDKYFYFCRFIDPIGDLKPNDEGDFKWVKFSKFKNYFKKPFETVDRLMYITDRILDIGSQLTFEEIKHFADNF